MTREEINEWANRNNNALHCLRVMVDEEVCEEVDAWMPLPQPYKAESEG